MDSYNTKDYTMENDNNHYCGVPSMYGRLCEEQYKLQPKYSWPGEAGGSMQGEKRNVQAGA